MKSKAEYMREYRASHPDYVDRARKLEKARKRALYALARRHRLELARLERAEIARLEIAGEL